MGFYDLNKEDRVKIVQQIYNHLRTALETRNLSKLLKYFSDDDTYIRKTAYRSIGKLFSQEPEYRDSIMDVLSQLVREDLHTIRQTTINAAGEIGMKHFEIVESFFDKGLFDKHHTVRNAVIGSIKKMGEKNPVPVLQWAKKYLHHSDKEIRREICHGIELRGRTHPEDILPLLKELQYDSTTRVKTTLIHVLGQISYKKGCLIKVVKHLNTWENTGLVAKAIEEIIDVHERYRNFAALTSNEAKKYIEETL
jgi:HEAT repeat protein